MKLIGLLFLISVIFFPGSIFLRPEYGLCALTAIWAIPFTRLRLFKDLPVEASLFFVLILSASISLLAQSALTGTFVFRDTMIIFRYGYYFTAIILGFVVASREISTRTLLVIFLLATAATVALSIVQYWNLFGLNQHIVSFYTPRDELLIHGSSWRRTVGTLGNPNYWGHFISILLLVCCFQMFWRGRIIWLLPAAPLFFSLILSGSRGALVSTVAACLAFGVIALTFAKRAPKLWSVMLVLSGAALVFGYTSVSEQYENQNRFSLDNLRTLELRIQHWSRIWARTSEDPVAFVVGEGPSKSTGIRWGDNQYIRLLRDFGLIGLGAYLFLYSMIVLRTFHLFRSGRSELETMAGTFLLVWLAKGVFDFSADSWFDVRTTGLVLFLYGMLLAFGARSEQIPIRSRLRKPYRRRRQSLLPMNPSTER